MPTILPVSGAVPEPPGLGWPDEPGWWPEAECPGLAEPAGEVRPGAGPPPATAGGLDPAGPAPTEAQPAAASRLTRAATVRPSAPRPVSAIALPVLGGNAINVRKGNG